MYTCGNEYIFVYGCYTVFFFPYRSHEYVLEATKKLYAGIRQTELMVLISTAEFSASKILKKKKIAFRSRGAGLVLFFFFYNDIVFTYKSLNDTVDRPEFLYRIGFQVPAFTSRNKSGFRVPFSSKNHVIDSPICRLPEFRNESVGFDFNYDPTSKLKLYALN